MTRRFIFWATALCFAPVVAVALVGLGQGLFSVAVAPVSLSFRFFAQDRYTDVLRAPSPVVASGLLVGSVALLWILRRACYRDVDGPRLS